MKEASTPSAVPIDWRVTRKADGVVLGTVTHRLAIDARDEACTKFKLEPFEFELGRVSRLSVEQERLDRLHVTAHGGHAADRILTEFDAVRGERDALMKLVDTLGAGPCPDRDRFMAILKQAMAAEVPAQAPADPTRCPKCHWPFAESAKDGCVPGNCSYRGAKP